MLYLKVVDYEQHVGPELPLIGSPCPPARRLVLDVGKPGFLEEFLHPPHSKQHPGQVVVSVDVGGGEDQVEGPRGRVLEAQAVPAGRQLTVMLDLMLQLQSGLQGHFDLDLSQDGLVGHPSRTGQAADIAESFVHI